MKAFDFSQSAQDRRRYPRVKVMYLASCINTENGVQQQPITMGRVLDISPGGARLEVNAEVRAGTEMAMTIGVQNGQIQTTGTVVHSAPEADRKRMLGIEFKTPIQKLAIDA